MMDAHADSTADIACASKAGVYELFRARVRRSPDAVALSGRDGQLSYGALDDRVRRLAAALIGRGVTRGDRIALLSENRFEYVEVQLAAARIGAIVACQNWRLTESELTHCVSLVSPVLGVTSPRFAQTLRAVAPDLALLAFGDEYEAVLQGHAPVAPLAEADPEAGLVILYTSGTTGLPKGALISHRAEIARMTLARMDFGIGTEDGFIAWAPMFHMGSTDQMLGALMTGATVHVSDGLDAEYVVEVLRNHRIGWLLLMPGSIEPVVEILARDRVEVKGVRVAGAMIDLVPRALAAELARLVGAPYLNSFGSTETGLAPASARTMAPEELFGPLSKWTSSLADAMLVDEAGDEVPDGEPGEMSLRGPTLFSGYWNAAEANAKDFAGGRFRMGDMFVRNPDGSFDFVDRAKYMIKSGGENIYPAEIERVLLADPRIRDAVVVRKPHDHWGEVPVAFVACHEGQGLDGAEIERLCRAELAGYKRPKEVHFITFDALPRSTTGKILRHEIERMLPH